MHASSSSCMQVSCNRTPCCRKHRVEKPHLIVVPLSTIPNWERELATWAPSLNAVIMVGNQTARDNVAKHELYLPPKGKTGSERSARMSGSGAELQVGCSCCCCTSCVQCHLAAVLMSESPQGKLELWLPVCVRHACFRRMQAC